MIKFHYIAFTGTPTQDNIDTIAMSQGSVDIDIDKDKDLLDVIKAIAVTENAKDVDIYRFHSRRTIGVSTLREELRGKSLKAIATNCAAADSLQEFLHLRVDSNKMPSRETFIACVHMQQTVDAPPAGSGKGGSGNGGSEADDLLAQLVQGFNEFVDSASKAKTPSTAAKSNNYNNNQATNAALLDGRFNAQDYQTTAAPPIELYHRVFADFSRRARDTSLPVPDDITRLTAALMRCLSAISIQEKPRDINSRDILNRILGVGLETVPNQDKTAADYAGLCPTPLHVNAAHLIAEVKGELGLGGSDPSVQSSFSYTRFYVNEQRKAIRDICCCPAFLIGLAGPWLVIMGAVLTSQVIVQRLTGYMWLGCSRIMDDRQVLHIARHFHALRLSMADLQSYYAELTVPAPLSGQMHPRFCPSITSFVDANKNQVQFVYVQPLERDPTCVTFLAIRKDTNAQVVVKFVRRYSEAAHHWMAAEGLAPELIHYGLLGDAYDSLALVVMGYVDGQTLDEAYRKGPLPDDISCGVRRALDILHSGGFVFGDLRRSNLMLAKGNGSVEQRIRVIDFDWAGKEGPDLRYPFHLSEAVRVASGAEDYDPIRKEHQEKMLNVL